MMSANVEPQFVRAMAAFTCYGGFIGLICAVATGAGISAVRQRSFAAMWIGAFYASFPGATLSALTSCLIQLLVISVTGLPSGKGQHVPVWAVVVGWIALLLPIVVAGVTAIVCLPDHSASPTKPSRFRQWLSLTVWSVLGSFVGVAVSLSLFFSLERSQIDLGIYPGVVMGAMSAAIWHFAKPMISRLNVEMTDNRSVTASLSKQH